MMLLASDGGHQWQRSSDKTTLKPTRTVVKLKLEPAIIIIFVIR
jgi:hypothetical protein